MKKYCRSITKKVTSTFAVSLYTLFLALDTVYACCVMDPIIIESSAIIDPSESNTVVKISYRSTVITSPTDSDFLLKEKTVSTDDMIADLVNRFSTSNIVTIGMIQDVEPYYSDFDTNGLSFARERVKVTFDSVLKGNLVPGDYEFIYTLWGDERQLVYDSTTGETDTIFNLISLSDPGYRRLIGKRFLHFATVENPQTADYVASKPDPCSGINGFFLDEDEKIEFTGITFSDANNFTSYPLLSVPVETLLERVNTPAGNRTGQPSIHYSDDATRHQGAMELYTITGRRIPLSQNRRNIDGVAAGLYLRRDGNGGIRQKNLLTGSGNIRK